MSNSIAITRGRLCSTVLVTVTVLLVQAMSLGSSAGAAPPEIFRGRFLFQHSDDFVAGEATFDPAIELDDGTVLRLDFGARPEPELNPGARIRVQGVRQGRRIMVAADGAQQTSGSGEGPVAAAGVTKKVAVILFNFQNDTSQPYTRAHARGVAFDNANSVAAFYLENSWGSLTLTGDVFGWFTIPHDNSGCPYSTWASAANQVASSSGVNLTRYDNLVYAFPRASGCSWGGLASLPGRNSWLNGPGAMSLRTFAHELGHNFGTHHAATLICTVAGTRVSLSTSSSNCTTNEYGDPFTIMGGAARYHHTNFSRGNFGWLQAANTKNVTTSGDYALTPIEYHAPTSVQSLRIKRANNSFLTLEFRQRYGTYFEDFAATSPVGNGVTVRIAPNYTSRTISHLVDTTPSTTTFTDAPLEVGQTLVDPVTGVSIMSLSVGPSGANVRVLFRGDAPPSPTPSPSPSPSPSPGPSPSPSPSPSPTSSPTPPPPVDTQPPTMPGDLTATPLGPKKIGLSWTASTDNVGVAGYRIYRNGGLVATVTSNTFTDTGLTASTTYGYQVVAFDAAANGSGPAMTSATTLARKDTRPPKPPPNVKAEAVRPRTALVTWNASTDNVGVAGYRVFRNDRRVATISRLRFKDRLPHARMSPTYSVVAFDAAGNVSSRSRVARLRR